MSNKQKAIVGAVGGLALVLLKLIEVQFFVDDVGSKKAIAAYLTYGSYVLLGVFVAMFFTDENPDVGKARKNAFIAGLLAPSLLLAVVRQPIQAPAAEQPKPAVPQIMQLFVGTAFAQGATRTPVAPSQVPVVDIKKEQFEGSFQDGFRIAIGRPETKKDRLFVVGQASSEEKAVAAAASIQKVLADKQLPYGSRVVRPSGSDAWYVTVGGANDPAAAAALSEATRKAALDTLTGPGTSQSSKDAASLMIQGRVVQGAGLFK